MSANHQLPQRKICEIMNIIKFLKLCNRAKIIHIKRITKKYARAFIKSPLATNSFMTGVFMAAGDVVSQKILEQPPYNTSRSMKMGIVGGALVGPLLFGFYRFMEIVVGPGRPLVKVAMDQILFTPFVTPALIIVIDLVEGKTWKKSIDHVRQELWHVLKATYYVWPFIQCVNFTFVPFRYRIFVVQVASLVWNTYFAWTLHVEMEERKRRMQLQMQNRWKWLKKKKVQPD